MTPHNINEDGTRKAVTHGELFLLPVNKVPKGEKSEHSAFVLAHSETGHNHVLKTLDKKSFTVTEVGDSVERYLTLESLGELTHQKTFDVHETRILAPGSYKVYYKKEYDVREQAMRRVFD